LDIANQAIEVMIRFAQVWGSNKT